jgi:hypothetical protein
MCNVRKWTTISVIYFNMVCFSIIKLLFNFHMRNRHYFHIKLTSLELIRNQAQTVHLYDSSLSSVVY